MSRNPKLVRKQTGGAGDHTGPGARAAAVTAAAMAAAIEAPVEAYPLRSGGRAAPDRSRAPDIGAACHETRTTTSVAPAPPSKNAGPFIGPVDSGLPEKQSEYDRARREGRS
jgi:hypothetical protein